MKLKFENHYTKYLKRPEDIAMIEIKECDEIYKYIRFLDYDLNCIKSRYSKYKGQDVFSIEHPYGEDGSSASGTIVEVYENTFDHNISTDSGSSGCPIILLNNKINLLQVIGIHKEGDKIHNINGGTFIEEIFDKDLNKKVNTEKNKNYIIAEIFIKKENVNKNIRIINSCDKNEDEIKKCEIKINNKIIPFNYFYKFESEGKYIIQYSFKNNINETCFMFSDCELLTNIDLSNFNTYNVTKMGFMFCGCTSLTNINLSNFNANNISDMFGIFFGCSSLNNIDLSNLNTNNISKMGSMFWGCSSLKKENIITKNEIIRNIKINQPTIKVNIVYDFNKEKSFNCDLNTKLGEVLKKFAIFFHLIFDSCYIIINGSYIDISDFDKPLFRFISPLEFNEVNLLTVLIYKDH